MCLQHRIYICDNECKTPSCPKVPITSFLKKTRLQKKSLLNSFKTFKNEEDQNFSYLIDYHTSMVNGLKHIKNNIVTNIDKVIDAYSDKIRQMVDKEVRGRSKSFFNNLHSLEQGGKLIEIHDLLASTAFGKIRKEERKKVDKLTEMFASDSLHTHLLKYLKGLERQSASLSNEFKGLQLDNIKQAKQAKAENYKRFSTIISQEVKYFFQTPTFLFKSKEKQDPAVLDSYTRKTSTTERGPSKRGTELIENSLHLQLDFHARRRKTIERERKKSKLTEVEDIIDEEDFSFNSDSFESEEIFSESFSGDELNKSSLDRIAYGFEEARGQLKEMMEKMSGDLKDEGFFDRGDKQKVNERVRSFIEEYGEVSQELLLNFNKL